MTYAERELRNQFQPAKCPCCGKDIMIPTEPTDVFCSYCGSRFLADAARQYAAACTLRGKMQEPKIQVSTERTRPATPLPRLMTIKQVANTGIVTEYALRTLITQNRIPYVRIGNRSLINYEKLLEFLNVDTTEPENNT